MRNVKRHFKPGDTVFITSVTNNRVPLLRDHALLLLKAMAHVGKHLSCHLEAYVILPDHFHIIVASESNVFSNYIKKTKEGFALLLRQGGHFVEGRIWQHRFWDHIIRDEDDWRRHISYIHYNPVKHGLTDDPFLWEYSSIRSFLEAGQYERNWGRTEFDFGDSEYGE
jgi:putative transposase